MFKSALVLFVLIEKEFWRLTWNADCQEVDLIAQIIWASCSLTLWKPELIIVYVYVTRRSRLDRTRDVIQTVTGLDSGDVRRR